MENTTVKNVRLGVNRAHTEWVNTEEIVPNPLNPRKDDSVKTEELQSIIKKRGWEMPLTVYRKGKIYVVLAGHRRLYAARAAKIRQIPVFIVEAPKTLAEEMERIASAQLAQEDWTQLEWARFVHERWLAWGRPSVTSFAKEVQIHHRKVEAYVKVLEFFPLFEIEGGLINKTLSISTLYDLMIWIKKMRETHAELIQSMTEDMVRRLAVDKLSNRKISKESLRKKDFLDKVKESDLKRFLMDKNMHLEELMSEYEYNVKEKSFHAQTVSMGHARKAVKNFNPKNANEAKKAYEMLKSVEESLKLQLGYIQKKYPSVDTTNSLFDWEKK